jgi:cellulose synthase (UDP-forming)
LRLLILTNLLLGLNYLSWRYLDSLNWRYWPLALALLAAESYSFVDSCLFGTTIWRARRRGEPPAPLPDATVDVYVTCYNEPVELVRETVRAAVAIRHPHRTWVLDDGNSVAMRAMAESLGAGYLVRTTDWVGRSRHAKAGNINNALFQTDGEFILVLDADQIPRPEILDRTLGYLCDPAVAFVQTPQWFYNVPPGDPFGSQAPLFYGPIQQGKDGWNAAFFCGSNAVLRREALMQIGVVHYAEELERRVRRALRTADRLLINAQVGLRRDDARARTALRELRKGVLDARASLDFGRTLQEVTWTFQRRAEEISRQFVADDLARITAELAEVPGVEIADLDLELSGLLEDDARLAELSGRLSSPLAAIEVVRRLFLAVDVDRDDEALPVMPMSTISVTEDMATAMRLHAAGWRSVYHDEILAVGRAPEDLRSALQQRLRWAQGTLQVMLRENPLLAGGLSLGQRLMYFATMWSYLSGFFAVIYLLAPILYLLFGWLPVEAYAGEFFIRFVPYLAINQLLFLVVGWGRPTWRGQQYSLALFPLWIRAAFNAAGSIWLRRPLGFIVTPKTRQAGAGLVLIWPQVAIMALLVVAAAFGLARLTMGLVDDHTPLLVNLGWACYDLLALSAVVDAWAHRPASEADASGAKEPVLAGDLRGRVGASRA